VRADQSVAKYIPQFWTGEREERGKERWKEKSGRKRDIK